MRQHAAGNRSSLTKPVRAEQQPVHLEARAGFLMHMIRFARRDDITAFSSRILGDVRPELILRNSHDRSSSFRIDAGLFRLACLNGLVVSDRLIDRVTVPHVRVSLQAFVHAASHISERSPLAAETINRWRAHRLTRPLPKPPLPRRRPPCAGPTQISRIFPRHLVF